MGAAERKKWLFALFSALLVSLLLFLTAISGLNASYAFTSWSNKPTAILNRGPQFPPSFAYYIYGGAGDKEQILRLLLAVYHPRNWYLLHLSADASAEEREWLVAAVRSVPAIQAFENVEVIGKPIWLTYMGATNIAATLRAAAVLLKLDDGWDWFITLSASDYPLLTQDGSPWVMLSRSFLEFCLFGWDNLPRTILMYFNNAVLPEEGYFHSVICNSPEFRNTTVNNDLRYMIWDSPPKMAPHFLNVSDFDQMIQSGAAFARRFQKDDPVLTMIDENILHRRHNRVAPGSWCSGRDSWFTDACAQWGDINSLKPGLQAKRFADSMTNYIDDLNSQSTQCK
uniref:Uncharacterized protein n=1 Tax=Chenopodium quinoa TaxID=63459 RepID=A0A803N301_CHEQI